MTGPLCRKLRVDYFPLFMENIRLIEKVAAHICNIFSDDNCDSGKNIGCIRDELS